MNMSSAGVLIRWVSSDILPRTVVDYTNAHQYINPDSELFKIASIKIFVGGFR